MGPARKHELDKRLADYSATLRSSRLEETRKQRSGNWQIYAAVTGSALAMATSAAAGTIEVKSGPINVVAGPIPNVSSVSASVGPLRTQASANIQLNSAQGAAIPVSFRIGVNQTSGDGVSNGAAWLNGGSQVGFLHGTRSATFFVKNLASGTKTSAKAGFFSTGKNFVATQQARFSSTGSGSSFARVDPVFAYGWAKSLIGYAGFSFSYGGQKNYGWVKLQFTTGTNGLANQIEAYNWQYTTEGNASPEPSTFALALLAAGAAGVAALRRRRKAAA
ncbi:MAG: PEP-CTERM sorting domain-containing protein [Bryobacteraceae bacterium]|jgi:MYXO-CTERM domain-containing protein